MLAGSTPNDSMDVQRLRQSDTADIRRTDDRKTIQIKIIPLGCVHGTVLVALCSKEYARMAKCLITKSWLNFCIPSLMSKQMCTFS